MIDLQTLNEDQKKAVLNNEGPLMILAGAGSGKTRTLVAKISYLIEKVQVSPYQILGLTFSNKAAKEMRERISMEVKADIGALQITTFHAFCAKVLRSEATHIGLSRNFTIYDKSESKAIVKHILSRHGVSTKEVSPFEVLYFIDDLKNNGYYCGCDESSLDYEVDKDDVFFQYYLEYEEELRKANSIDFGGLIVAVIELFEKFPKVVERYQDRFRHVLVDEYQDTNRAQFHLVRMICEKRQNICVVGDEDQSIYSWRGADIRNILDFEEAFPSVKTIKLEQNYRSSKIIIEAASAVIAKNSQRKGKSMWTENPAGENIEIIECESDKKEAEFVCTKIKQLHEQGIAYKEMAVFYRTNAQSRIIEDYLRQARTPYRIIGGIKFYERKEIKDILGYIKVVVNSKDSLSLSRIINVPARGIGATSLRKLENEAVTKGVSLFEIIDEVCESPEDFSHLRLSAKVKSSLGSLVMMIKEAQALEVEKEKPSKIYEKILYESGYWEHLKSLKDYESQARLENLQELQGAIKQYETSTDTASLSEYIETITLDATNDDLEDQSSGDVSLMTIHGAKGLEFFYVFIVGAEENVFPSYRSLESGDDFSLEEERRLFYVAMTRAMERLYICFAQGRMLFGQVKFNGPSRFLDEIPEQYYIWTRPDGASRENWSNQPENDWDEFSQDIDTFDDVPVYQVQKGEKEKSKFAKGVNVKHSLYGVGKVIKSQGSGPNEKVTIMFDGGVNKKFMVKFAPLEIV